MALVIDLTSETFVRFTFAETGKVISVIWMTLGDGRLALSQCCDPEPGKVPLHQNLAALKPFEPREIWPDVTLCYETHKGLKLLVTAPLTVGVIRGKKLTKIRQSEHA